MPLGRLILGLGEVLSLFNQYNLFSSVLAFNSRGRQWFNIHWQIGGKWGSWYRNILHTCLWSKISQIPSQSLRCTAVAHVDAGEDFFFDRITRSGNCNEWKKEGDGKSDNQRDVHYRGVVIIKIKCWQM